MCLRISTDVCVAIVLTVAAQRTSDQKGGLNDAKDRIFWYRNSLHLWNQDHTIRDHVTVVENSMLFDHHEPHLETIRYQHSQTYEMKHCGHPTKAMGEHELIAVHEAMERSTRIAHATHVVKITGRYFIPGFADAIRNLTSSDEIIHMHGHAGGCQVMGCRVDVCASLWRCPYDRFSHCEATVKHRMHNHSLERRFELPELHTAYTIAGSSGKGVWALP